MSCEICGRNSCTRSFHSIEEQDRFDCGLSEEEAEIESLRAELAAANVRAEMWAAKAGKNYSEHLGELTEQLAAAQLANKRLVEALEEDTMDNPCANMDGLDMDLAHAAEEILRWQRSAEINIEENVKLRAELAAAQLANKRLMKALEKIAHQDIDRRIQRKVDQCKHGRFGWEDCDLCVADFAEAALSTLSEKQNA